MRKLSILSAFLMVLGLLAVTTPAEAVRKWPRGRITYVDLTKDKDSVKRAVRAWNRSGVKVRFVKVRSKKRAKLIIRNTRRVPSGCGSGLATLGYTPGRKAYVHILHGRPRDGQTCAWPGQTLVMAHELGHVLGLGHVARGCSLMNTSHTGGIAPTNCYNQEPEHAEIGSWRCAIFAKRDLRKAKRMYGGKIKPLGPKWCLAAPKIATAGPVTVTVDQWGNPYATLTRRAEPDLPAWMPHWTTPGFEVHVTPDTCSAKPGDRDTMVWSNVWEAAVPIGGTIEPTYIGDLEQGTHCVSYWQYDRAGRYSQAASSVMVTIPAQRDVPRRLQPAAPPVLRIPDSIPQVRGM